MNDYLKIKELYHYGIKGQKWGVRRFQKEDGSLTSEGQKRDEDPLKKDVSKQQLAVAGLGATGAIFKGLKDVSDASSKILDGKGKSKKVFSKYPDIEDKELRQKLNRLKMESEYSDLVGDTKFIKSGSEKAREVLQTIGGVAGLGAALTTIVLSIVKIRSGNRGVN